MTDIIDPILIYFDETGDHSLDKIDKDFPIFVLTTIAVRHKEYINNIIPKFFDLKIKTFGHEGVVFHSRDIRKSKPPFDFMMNKSKRNKFLGELTSVLNVSEFRLIVSIIKKEELREQYIYPYNPYKLALKFNLERVVILLEKVGQKNAKIIAESRGKNEDDQLLLSFFGFLHKGTERIEAERFKSLNLFLEFLPKERNIVGTQIADLCGYPIGRHILAPEKENKSFEVVKKKIGKELDDLECFKIFP